MKRRRFFEAVTTALLVATGLMLGTVDVQAQEGAFFGLGTGVVIQHASADGSNLVGWRKFPDGHREAILWTDGSGTVLLGTLGGTHSFAGGISADGSTVVGDSDNAEGIREAFLWNEVTGMVGLGPVDGLVSTWAWSTSYDGSTIAGGGYGSSGAHAVVWTSDNGGRILQDVLTNDYGLDLAGWVLDYAVVSADGKVFSGTGTNPDGQSEAWIAMLASVPPVAIASIIVDGENLGDFAEVPCQDHHGTLVTLDGSASYDPDGDNLEFEWSVAEGSGILLEDPTGAVTEGLFPVGVHEVTLAVYDLDEDGERIGGVGVDSVTIVVFDETPPVALVTTDLAALWPANNKMIPVEIHVFASDFCTAPEDLLVFCTITSSQPDDTDGTDEAINDVNGSDGYTAAVEIELVNLGNGEYSALVELRAERDGDDKAGRIYSIHVEAWDVSGNVGYASSTVVVPHSQGKKK